MFLNSEKNRKTALCNPNFNIGVTKVTVAATRLSIPYSSTVKYLVQSGNVIKLIMTPALYPTKYQEDCRRSSLNIKYLIESGSHPVIPLQVAQRLQVFF